MPRFGVTVTLGRNLGTMYVCHSANLRLVRLGAVQGVIHWKKVLPREFVDPLDQNSLAAAHLEGWPGHTPAVSPLTSRREIPVQRCCEFGHFDPIVRQLDLAIRGARARTLAVSQRGYG